jgi:tetratricopeptide (TPR) repeat protein
MGGIISSAWFITIVGGALASLAATLIAAYVLNRRPSVLKLYHRALEQVCDEFNVIDSEKLVLRNALKDKVVVKTIKLRTSDPGIETQRLCKSIAYYAPLSSRLADSAWVTTVVERWLYIEFLMEDTEKYQNFHRNRQPYFAVPPAPTGLVAVATSQQIILTWNPVPHPGIWRYHIARSTSVNGPFTKVDSVQSDSGTLLSFTDEKGIVNGTRYYYTVTAESNALRRGYSSAPIPVEYNLPATPINPGSSLTSVVSSTFFIPPEVWKEMADKSVDRKQELEKLLSDFNNAGRRLFLIEGFGGLGKTTLAAKLALAVSQRYSVLWVDCRGIPVAAERFLREMGWFAANQYEYPLLSAIVENPQLTQEEKNNALLDFFAFTNRSNSDESVRPIALFFDDYHLMKDAALKQLVQQIAESYLDVKVVFTIRYLPPELQNEVDRASALQLEGLGTEGCRELIEVNASSYPGLRDLDDRRLQHIWKLTGQGVPTALRILISMTRKLSLDDVLEELPTLTTATREKWFDKLFRELSPEEQQVATEASIFRRPVLRRALIAVSRCPRAREVIETLVDRFVLTFDGKFYSMHALWSDYTGSRLSSSDARELHLRAATFFRDFESSHDRYTEVMSRLESCYHFIKAEDMDQAERELISIAGTLRSWGFFQEFTDILVEIEKDAAKRGKVLTPQLKLEKGAMLYAQGVVDEAIASLNELANTNTGEIEIKALQELGWIYIEIGRRREAEGLLKRSRQLAHQSNLPELEAEALEMLQHIAYHECDYDKALACNEERLGLLQQMKDDPYAREAIAWTHHEIGNVYRERGFYEKALELYQQDLSLWSELGNPPRRVAWIIYDIGQIYRDQGKLQDALNRFEEALRIFTRMQHFFGIAHVKIELGRIGVKLGPPDRAIQQVEEALELLRSVKGVAGEAYARGALGQIYLSLGKPDDALPYLQQSLEMETKLHSIKGRAWSLHQISLAYEQQGKRFLLSGSSTEACTRFCEASTTIAQAQELFTQTGAAPNIRGIQNDAVRIQQECAECTGSA